ncbi:hypothetical protein B0E42_01690 [Pseudomonas sp. A25(2017)]|nr:hypothetical protein B0E42_01690 [Pseudomonas sp. A25(2017)]
MIHQWEQSLLAMQAPWPLGDRVSFIAGKPCSHRAVPFVPTQHTSTRLEIRSYCAIANRNPTMRKLWKTLEGASLQRPGSAPSAPEGAN